MLSYVHLRSLNSLILQSFSEFWSICGLLRIAPICEMYHRNLVISFTSVTYPYSKQSHLFRFAFMHCVGTLEFSYGRKLSVAKNRGQSHIRLDRKKRSSVTVPFCIRINYQTES